jgi:hypothetical protein
MGLRGRKGGWRGRGIGWLGGRFELDGTGLCLFVSFIIPLIVALASLLLL